MKSKKYLACLIFQLLLVGCSNTTNSSKPSSNTSNNDLSSSTSNNISSSSTSSDYLKNRIEEKIGTPEKLKNLLIELSNNIQEITYSTIRSKDTTTINAQIKTQEIVVKEESEGQISTKYTGIVNGYFYQLNDSKWSPKFSKEKVSLDEEISSDNSKLAMSYALEQLNYEISTQTNLTNEMMWGNLFREDIEGTTYKTYVIGKNIAIQYETYYVVKYGEDISVVYQYNLAATLDQTFNLIEGNYTQSTYRSENYDKETGRPLENSEPDSKESVSIIDVKYGEIEETSLTPMIDLSPYSVSSLTSKANIVTEALDTKNWVYIYSDANIVWLGKELILNIKDPNTNELYYLPETALNSNDLKIISSSNEELISLTENDYGQKVWMVTSKSTAVNKSVNLGIGFEGEEAIATISVTIANYEEETESLPTFEEKPFILNSENAYYNDTNKMLYITSLDEPIYIKLCSPEYTIDDYDKFDYYMHQSSINPNFPIQIDFSYETAESQNDYEGLWLKLTPLAKGTVRVTMYDRPDMGEPTELLLLKVKVDIA